ncbi:MBL fold metallo-hydrolase [Bradyrhizobium sp. 14AA]
MLKRQKFGEAELFQIFEICAPITDRRAMLPGLSDRALQEHADLLTDQYRFWSATSDRLILAIKIFVLRLGNLTILIDTGEGNFKTRPAPWSHNLNTPVLDWLDAIGVPPRQVTHVIHTHLHHDHVGWNTVREGDEWVPLFKNAEYFVPAVDWNDSNDRFNTGDRSVNQNSFEDSVLPIAKAGNMRLFEAGDVIAGHLKATGAIGHSPGQVNLTLQEGGRNIIFCADVFHSPIQVFLPEVNSKWCELPVEARNTRKNLLETAANSKALLFPAHSTVSEGWLIDRVGAGYAVSFSA